MKNVVFIIQVTGWLWSGQGTVICFSHGSGTLYFRGVIPGHGPGTFGVTGSIQFKHYVVIVCIYG